MKESTRADALATASLEQLARQFNMPDLMLPFWGYRKRTPMHCIVRLEGEGNYTIFHFADGSQLMVSLTLKTMESRLSPKVFVRPHKKNIINLLYLEDIYTNPQQLSVGLSNGHRVDVSRRKASRFMKQVRGFQEEVRTLRTQRPTVVTMA